jgi:hypothetical protein
VAEHRAVEAVPFRARRFDSPFEILLEFQYRFAGGFVVWVSKRWGLELEASRARTDLRVRAGRR